MSNAIASLHIVTKLNIMIKSYDKNFPRTFSQIGAKPLQANLSDLKLTKCAFAGSMNKNSFVQQI